MPYKNIVFVKLEKRLLNDHRWFTMSDASQLIYIKLILTAAETYNKIPKNDDVLREVLRYRGDLDSFSECMLEIKNNFPKLKENKHFRYFDEFDTKTNYHHQREFPGKSQGVPKVSTDKEEEEEEDKEEEKEKETGFPFDSIWSKYPNKDGRKQAERSFKASVKTDKDWADINTALANYVSSERVNKGFIKNGSTWFNNWRDWVTKPTEGVDDGLPDSLKKYSKKYNVAL